MIPGILSAMLLDVGSSGKFANLIRLGQAAGSPTTLTVGPVASTARSTRYVAVLYYAASNGGLTINGTPMSVTTLGGFAFYYVGPVPTGSTITANVNAGGSTAFMSMFEFDAYVTPTTASGNAQPALGAVLAISYGYGSTFSFTHGADSYLEYAESFGTNNNITFGVATAHTAIDTSGSSSTKAFSETMSATGPSTMTGSINYITIG